MNERDDVREPLMPREVARIMAPATFPWWIAGGHAIDHAVGRQVRSHADIDVLILRADHVAARTLLSDWDCWAADPPGRLQPWAREERLPNHVSDVWCRCREGEPWQLQFMLDDGDEAMWQSRRCAAVIKPIAELGVRDEFRVTSSVAYAPDYHYVVLRRRPL